MRVKFYAIRSLAIASVAMGWLSLATTKSSADQIYLPVLNPVSPAAVDRVPSVRRVPGKDYTDALDVTHVPTPHAVNPSQLGMFDGLGGAQDGLRLGDMVSQLGEFNVDAQSQVNDVLFDAVVANRAPLIVSTSFDGMLNDDVALAAERTTGAVQSFAKREQVVRHPHPGGTLRDIDSVDLWGPEAEPHAGFYSFQSDPGGTAVFSNLVLAPGGVQPYLSTTQIANAIGDPEVAQILDVDAIMVRDVGDGFNPFDGEFNQGDAIMFSIAPIVDANGGVRYDGGEVWVWEHGQPADFLKHGGHVWDTAFDVGATFRVNTENIDALEAAGAVPEPSTAVLLLGCSFAAIWFSHRRADAMSQAGSQTE